MWEITVAHGQIPFQSANLLKWLPEAVLIFFLIWWSGKNIIYITVMCTGLHTEPLVIVTRCNELHLHVEEKCANIVQNRADQMNSYV